jgi:hypothetical protein
VVAALVDAIVRYQRETGDNRGCLPILWYLQTCSVASELAERITAAHDIMLANTLGTLVPTPDDFSARHDAILAIITETLVPGLEPLGLLPAAQQDYFNRLAHWLKTQAIEVAQVDGDGIRAQHALALALGWPIDTATTELLVSTQGQFVSVSPQNLDVSGPTELPQHTFEVDERGLAFDEEWIASADITGLRHGWFEAEDGVAARYVIGWCTATTTFELTENALPHTAESPNEKYDRWLKAIYHVVVPSIIARLAFGRDAGIWLRHIICEWVNIA